MEDDKDQSRLKLERPEPTQDAPSGVVATEPECEGGDSPCWAHMLDDDGRLT
jgi:hypothetical protein